MVPRKPIIATLDRVAASLDQHAAALNETLAKVKDPNGGLRAHTIAVEALADRLVVDEAARAVLEAAARPKTRRAS